MVESRPSAWLFQLRPELAFLRGEDLPAARVLLMFSRMTVTMDGVSGAVDEAFPGAPDHLTFVTELPKAPTGNIWKFTLRERGWA
jgi:hypothetical protein